MCQDSYLGTMLQFMFITKSDGYHMCKCMVCVYMYMIVYVYIYIYVKNNAPQHDRCAVVYLVPTCGPTLGLEPTLSLS